jgi:GR25 family glycosyltransferase involved in LPS biosynthesis
MRTICLTLPETPERTDKARAHFAEQGLEDVEFFWGINGPLAGLSTTHVYEVDNPGSGFRMGAKCTGLWLSHYMLWNALTRAPEEQFLILENDAKFDENWKPRFQQALKDAPTNFDFLFIGSCCTDGWPKTQIGGEVFRINGTAPQCTHAYVIARKCLPFVLGTLRKCWAPLDCQLIFECFPSLKVFTLLPRAVSQFDTEIAP